MASEDQIACPHCDGGFVEQIETNPTADDSFPAAMSMFGDGVPNSYDLRRQGFRRRRRSAGSRSPFNPVIVLRGPAEGVSGGNDGADHDGSSFELYYDDGDGSGLRPLPPTMSEFLLGSGFDRLLEQFSQIEINGFGRPENPPASKSAIESMPTIDIGEDHVDSDAHCAVCKEAFEMGSDAREMPCKHIYHSDCILPWLSMRNSCPVCRHELPSDRGPLESRISGQTDEETVGLTIWRLPGGGFAVGRFSGSRRAGESHLPVVYTEMDGGINTNGAPRRIARAVRSTRVSESHRSEAIGAFWAARAAHARVVRWRVITTRRGEWRRVEARVESFGGNLKIIVLTCCHIVTDAAISAVADSCPNLVCLKLESCDMVTEKSLYQLGSCCLLLEELDLTDCSGINDIALKYLSRCSELSVLKLGLCKNVSDVGLAYIASNCPRMTELDLYRCACIGDDGLAALSSGCKKLMKLNLSYCNRITDRGMEYISHLGEVVDLELRGLNITSMGVKKVAASCKRLSDLDLKHCEKIDDSGFWAIASYSQNLRQINVSNCGVSDLVLCLLMGNLKRLQDAKLVHLSQVTLNGLELALRTCCGRIKKIKLQASLRFLLSPDILATLHAQGSLRWTNAWGLPMLGWQR